MKKIFLTLFLLFGILIAQAQIKPGLRFAPLLAFNSAEGMEEGNVDVSDQIENASLGLRYSAGPIVDFFFTDNYAFTTGLWFTVKRTGYRIDGKEDAELIYNSQYIQIPLGMKFFTNNIGDRMRIYTSVGGSAEFFVAENFIKGEEFASDSISGERFTSIFNAGLLISAGVELELGDNTTVFGGLTYNRGLLNAVSNKPSYNEFGDIPFRDLIDVRHDLFGLEIGVKF